jgi:hypothetical protein
MITLSFKRTENNYSLFNICFREVIEKIQIENSSYNLSYILPFYIDNLFRKYKILSTSSEKDIKCLIDDLLLIFVTLPDKDIFIDIHKSLVKLIF